MPRQWSGRISASPQAGPPASFKCGLHATQKPRARRDWGRGVCTSPGG